MSENISFIQGKKEQYNPSEMQGGLFFSKDSKEILLNGESYGNATPADEEDITAEDGSLKLKDRAYDEASFSGKGYVILRKNLVLQEDGTYKNILTQDMINQPNTIYEIRYDFTINTDIQNASLYITTGSLEFGQVQLDNISFYGDTSKIVITSLARITNCEKAPLGNLRSSFFLNDVKQVFLLRDINYTVGSTPSYWTSNNLNISDCNYIIDGKGHSIIANEQHNSNANITFQKINSLIIKDIILDGVTIKYDKLEQVTQGCNVVIEDCIIKNCSRFSISNCNNLTFRRCTFENAEIGGGTYNVDGLNIIKFLDCKFILGEYNTSNRELLHFQNTGLNGSLIVQNCTFIDNRDEAENASDWIDLYDNCNVIITNSHFVASKTCFNYSEGVINIKFQSSSTTDPASTQTDSNGSKYNVIIANNTFTFNNDSDSPTEFALVNCRSGVRESSSVDNSDVLNIRSCVSIHDNVIHLAGNILFHPIDIIESFNDIKFHDNIIIGKGSNCNMDTLFRITFNADSFIDKLGVTPQFNNIIYNNNIIDLEGNLLDLYRITDDTLYIKNLEVQGNVGRCNSIRYKDRSPYNTHNTYYKVCNNSIITNDASGEYTVGQATYPYLKSIGTRYYDITRNKPVYWSGTEWVDSSGNSSNLLVSGPTANRPTNAPVGFRYFDTDINCEIIWNGSQWVNTDGTLVSKVTII